MPQPPPGTAPRHVRTLWFVELAALGLSALSLIAVILIGRRQLRLGAEQLRLARTSTRASQESAAASARAGAAAVQAAAKVEQDAVVRRLEAVLEVVIEMRALWNKQTFSAGATGSGLVRGSPESLARLRLTRQLESRLVVVEEFSAQMAKTEQLVNIFAVGCGNTQLEGAVFETKQVLRRAAGLQPTQDP